MKYRMLCTYLFLADISYVEREIKKKKIRFLTYVTLSKGRGNTKKQHFKESKLPAGSSWRLKNVNPTQSSAVSLWQCIWVCQDSASLRLLSHFKNISDSSSYSQMCPSVDNKLYSDPIYIAFFFFNVVELVLSSSELIQLKLKCPATCF